jgi:hypothetical protein
MQTHHAHIRPDIYLLADHLDAMLAAGEDLLAMRRGLVAALASPQTDSARGRLVALRLFGERVQALELTVAMRTLEARKRAKALKREDTHLSIMAGLFIAGTAQLADAVDDLGDRTRFDFQTGHEIVSYLRSRGLIAPDCAGLIDLEKLCVTQAFLVARRIELGPLMDLAATFLDTLDVLYELYDDAEPGGQVGPASMPSAADRPISN